MKNIIQTLLARNCSVCIMFVFVLCVLENYCNLFVCLYVCFTLFICLFIFVFRLVNVYMLNHSHTQDCQLPNYSCCQILSIRWWSKMYGSCNSKHEIKETTKWLKFCFVNLLTKSAILAFMHRFTSWSPKSCFLDRRRTRRAYRD